MTLGMVWCLFLLPAEAVFPRADEVKARRRWTFECLLKPDPCGNVTSITSILRGDLEEQIQEQDRTTINVYERWARDPVSVSQL